jgi:hypothetical protein
MAFRLDRIGAFGSKQAAFRGGARLSLGVPVLALGASYLGFGALVRESGSPPSISRAARSWSAALPAWARWCCSIG